MEARASLKQKVCGTSIWLSLQNWSWMDWQKFALKATFLQILLKYYFLFIKYFKHKQQNFENLISHNICTEFFKKKLHLQLKFPEHVLQIPFSFMLHHRETQFWICVWNTVMNLVSICMWMFFLNLKIFLFWPAMWHVVLSSPTRAWIFTPCSGSMES